MNLSPIEIAAIGTAGVALLLVLIVIIYFIRKRVRKSRSRPTPPRARGPRTTFTTLGFGLPPASSSAPPFIAASPSTGQSTLVTPSSGKLKKGKEGLGLIYGVNGGVNGISGGGLSSPIILRPESEEMVMVTYEEGLEKLGLGIPHHILYPDHPPGFEEARQAYPVASPRPVQGRSGLVGGRGHEERANNRDRDRERNRDREGDRTPLTADARWDRMRKERTGGGVAIGNRPGHGTSPRSNPSPLPRPSPSPNPNQPHPIPRSGSGGRVKQSNESTWLPSYYHSPESRGRDIDDNESDLGYRGGEGGNGGHGGYGDRDGGSRI